MAIAGGVDRSGQVGPLDVPQLVRRRGRVTVVPCGSWARASGRPSLDMTSVGSSICQKAWPAQRNGVFHEPVADLTRAVDFVDALTSEQLDRAPWLTRPTVASWALGGQAALRLGPHPKATIE